MNINNSVKKAYLEIASTKGFSCEGGKDKEEYGTIGETQGTLEFREKVSEWVLKNPDLLNSENRQNIEADWLKIAKWKYYGGHISHMAGKFTVDGSEYDLEGMCEDLLLPWIWADLLKFFNADVSALYTDNERKWILEKYYETLSHHRAVEIDFADLAAKINSGEDDLPISIIGGHPWHGAAFVFIHSILIYWNSNNPFMQINKLEKDITPNLLKSLIRRHDLTEKKFGKLLEKIKALTKEEKGKNFKKKKQKCGNCVYKASKGVVQILTALCYALQNTKEDLTIQDIKEALEKTKMKFQGFSGFLVRNAVKELREDYDTLKRNRESPKDRAVIGRILKHFYLNERERRKKGMAVFSNSERVNLLRGVLLFRRSVFYPSPAAFS